jgi:hypothetical protein
MQDAEASRISTSCILTVGCDFLNKVTLHRRSEFDGIGGR